MPSLVSLRHRSCIAAAMLAAALAVGCVRPLAVQHEFFAPASGSADRIGTQTRHVVSHYRALQAARRACGPEAAAPAPAPPAETDVPAGPGPAFAGARKALAELCAGRERAPVAAHGGLKNAYDRWVGDEVRALPEASETAAAAAGGS